MASTSAIFCIFGHNKRGPSWIWSNLIVLLEIVRIEFDGLGTWWSVWGSYKRINDSALRCLATRSIWVIRPLSNSFIRLAYRNAICTWDNLLKHKLRNWVGPNTCVVTQGEETVNHIVSLAYILKLFRVCSFLLSDCVILPPSVPGFWKRRGTNEHLKDRSCIECGHSCPMLVCMEREKWLHV